MNDAPIGVFDSGLGGLTVWSELRRRLPRESLLYYGDGKNCPYGDKTREQVTEAVDFAVRRLVDRGVKLIVVACNAATAMAIDHLRAAYPIPFVGLEPAVKPAALSSRSGVIGILATAGTVRGSSPEPARVSSNWSSRPANGPRRPTVGWSVCLRR